MESQNKAIKAHLKKGNSITAMQALKQFGCFRLAARIKNLKDEGMSIQKIMMKNTEGKRIAIYFEGVN
jgi:hypothetical protein